jgi:maleate cis-trans isomerase
VLEAPYSPAIHALAAPFFASRSDHIVGDTTRDIVKRNEVLQVSRHRLAIFVKGPLHKRADAIVLLATDLPSFNFLPQSTEIRPAPR